VTATSGSVAPALPPSPELAERLGGSRLYLLLDIDGTLSYIAPSPELASVPVETRAVLADLALNPEVRLVLVTGRAASDGRRLAGVDGAWVLGNHGLERIDPDGAHHVLTMAAEFQPHVQHAAAGLETRLGGIPGVKVENKKWSLSVHYRLVDERSDGIPRVERAAREIAHEQGLRLTSGKKVFELRPPIEVNKGTAVLELLSMLGAPAPPNDRGAASVLYAGDDRTDEDAFRVLREHRPNAVTIRVGDPRVDGELTAAEFSLPNPEGTRELLTWLRHVRTPRDQNA
jgi:trehalose-phosphatase